jgi:hypothetical protein
MSSPSAEQKTLLQTYMTVENIYRSHKQLLAKLQSSIVYNSKCIARKVLSPNLEIRLSPYSWPKPLDKTLSQNCDAYEQQIFRQALTEIFLHRNLVLKNTYAHIVDCVNKHTTDQLLSQMFVHKQPTLVDYSTALENMVKRFRIDNPLSTHELSTTIVVPQPTIHESMRDTNATMDIPNPNRTRMCACGSRPGSKFRVL